MSQPRAQSSVTQPGIARGLRSLARSLGLFLPVLLLGTFATYLLGHLSGLSPAHLQLGESATPAAVARLEHEWGLDRPFVVQYLSWFAALVRGELGTSWYSGRAVADLLLGRALISISVAGVALLFAIVAGLALGALAALTHTSWIDRAITAFTTFISVMPSFVVGIALVTIFSVALGLLPSAGYAPFDEGLWPWFSHLLLPALALSLDVGSDVARQLRAGLVAAYQENYVVGARLRGLSERRIFFVHVLRNGIGPALAVLGVKFPKLLGGAVVTEAIFGLPGYGRFASESALRGDVPSVQGVLVVIIALVVVFNVLVNALLDRLMPASQRGL